MSETVPLNVSSMPSATEALDQELAAAIADVLARAHLDKERRVTLTIKVAPQADPATGEVMAISMWETNRSFPGQKGSTRMGTLKNGTIMVPREPVPVEPTQQALFTIGSEKGE